MGPKMPAKSFKAARSVTTITFGVKIAPVVFRRCWLFRLIMRKLSSFFFAFIDRPICIDEAVFLELVKLQLPALVEFVVALI